MDKKTIIAILFSLVFILAWDKYVVKKQNIVNNKENLKIIEATENGDAFPNDRKNTIVEENLQEKVDNNLVESEENLESKSEGVVQEQEVILQNESEIYTFTNKGALLKSIKLKNYKDKSGELIEFVNIEMARRGNYPFKFAQGNSYSIFNNKVFEMVQDGNKITFTYENLKGKIQKIFEISKQFNLNFTIISTFNGPPELSMGAGIMNSEKVKGRYSGIEDQIILFIDGVEKYEKKKIKKNLEKVQRASWGAVENRYFAKIVTNKVGAIDFKTRLESYKEGDKNYELSELVLLTNSGIDYDFYFGPKQFEILKKYNLNYEKLVDFGFFGLFGKWLFFLLKWLNGFIGNYGWSIVVMTVLIRIVLFPLNQMSLKSMKKMGELQPKIKEIQARYKKYGSDNTMKMKMNQEVAELYKKEGVNPAGGCLPMLIQMPVFFAIWGVLLSLIDLQNANFIFWITDLSSKDPYYILPVMMGATQFISQFITPSTGDKNQKMMMYAMPVVITVMLATAPSGLMVYWTTNNLFQMIQQIIINIQTKKEQA